VRSPLELAGKCHLWALLNTYFITLLLNAHAFLMPFRSKDDGSGETIGHDSGRKIVAILEKNPKKDPSKYEQDDIDHMRKVVAYCKRHLAQEDKAKQDTSSKSYKSLKNWGHDAQKA
jgi:hypothetical protein